MRSLSTLATLLLGLAVVFWAPAAKAHCPHGNDANHERCGPAAASNEFRFTGFTDETFNGEPDTIDGGQGMIAMHALCQDDFGLDARMCTGEEFWLSPNAEAPSADAWLHNKPFQSTAFSPTDFTGFAHPNENCRGWTITAGGVAAIVTTDGKPAIVSCDIARPVTCCAPIQ